MADLVEYYNKFNEDKRLLSRHGQVEFAVTMHYIKKYIAGRTLKIADIGAGTGRYSIALSKEGHELTSYELVKYNLGILKKHAREEGLSIEAYNGDARKLKHLKDNTYDITLLLGPMYHLHSDEDKAKALSEALRVTKEGGIIFVAYVMADYAIVKYGFMEGYINESISKNALNEDYSIKSDENELYDYVRLCDIDRINKLAGAKRKEIIAPDGPADYIRNFLNSMDDKMFETFIDYQIKNSSRVELLGASSHLLDIIVK